MVLAGYPPAVEVGMSDEEKAWRGKTDEEVLAAARRLADYTEG